MLQSKANELIAKYLIKYEKIRCNKNVNIGMTDNYIMFHVAPDGYVSNRYYMGKNRSTILHYNADTDTCTNIKLTELLYSRFSMDVRQANDVIGNTTIKVFKDKLVIYARKELLIVNNEFSLEKRFQFSSRVTGILFFNTETNKYIQSSDEYNAETNSCIVVICKDDVELIDIDKFEEIQDENLLEKVLLESDNEKSNLIDINKNLRLPNKWTEAYIRVADHLELKSKKLQEQFSDVKDYIKMLFSDADISKIKEYSTFISVTLNYTDHNKIMFISKSDLSKAVGPYLSAKVINNNLILAYNHAENKYKLYDGNLDLINSIDNIASNGYTGEYEYIKRGNLKAIEISGAGYNYITHDVRIRKYYDMAGNELNLYGTFLSDEVYAAKREYYSEVKMNKLKDVVAFTDDILYNEYNNKIAYLENGQIVKVVDLGKYVGTLADNDLSRGKKGVKIYYKKIEDMFDARHGMSRPDIEYKKIESDWKVIPYARQKDGCLVLEHVTTGNVYVYIPSKSELHRVDIISGRITIGKLKNILKAYVNTHGMSEIEAKQMQFDIDEMNKYGRCTSKQLEAIYGLNKDNLNDTILVRDSVLHTIRKVEDSEGFGGRKRKWSSLMERSDLTYMTGIAKGTGGYLRQDIRKDTAYSKNSYKEVLKELKTDKPEINIHYEENLTVAELLDIEEKEVKNRIVVKED